MANTRLLAVLLTVGRSSFAVSALHLQDLVFVALPDLLALPIYERESSLADTYLLAVLLTVVAAFIIVVVMRTIVALYLDVLVVSTFAIRHTLIINADQIWFANAYLTANPVCITFDMSQFGSRARLNSFTYAIDFHEVGLTHTDLGAGTTLRA